MGFLIRMRIATRTALAALLFVGAQVGLYLALREWYPANWAVAMFGFSLGGALLLCLTHSASISGRLSEIATRLNRAATTGDPAMIDRIDGDDEVSRVEREYNRLASAMKMREAKLALNADVARMSSQKSERKLTELEILYDISVALKEVYDLPGALAVCLDKIVDVIDVEWAFFTLYDPDRDLFTMEHVRGFTPEIISGIRAGAFKGHAHPSSGSLSGAVLRSGNELFSHDCARETRFKDFTEFAGVSVPVESFLALPVRDRDSRPIGVVTAINKRGDRASSDRAAARFGKPDITFMAEIGRLIFLGYEKVMAFQEAFLDSESGLFIQEYFLQRLKEEVVASRRDGRDVAVAVVSIDGLNDGTAFADPDGLDREAAARIRSLARTIDIACRMSRGVFGVLLPDTAKRGGLVFGSRICDVFSKEPLAVGGKPMRLTASVGIASWEETPSVAGADPDSVARAAMAAMEEARSLGGNRVRCSAMDGAAGEEEYEGMEDWNEDSAK